MLFRYIYTYVYVLAWSAREISFLLSRRIDGILRGNVYVGD